MNIKGKIINKTDALANICFEMLQTMYKKDYSEIFSLFYGIHISEIKSTESDYLSLKPEPFFLLTLSIENTDTLSGAFDVYTQTERLEGENKIHNESTNKKEICNRKILFWSLPDVLIITLKRFSNDNRKNNKLIHFPLENFDLSKYVIGYDKQSYVYDLYGICNHSGNVEGGHYTAFVKNANKKWYFFNDARQPSEIQNLEDLETNMAYCFFYRKKKTN